MKTQNKMIERLVLLLIFLMMACHSLPDQPRFDNVLDPQSDVPVYEMEVRTVNLSIYRESTINGFNIRNKGNRAFRWNAVSSQPFLKIVPDSGTVERQSTVYVAVVFDRNLWIPGVNRASITVVNEMQQKGVLQAKVYNAEYYSFRYPLKMAVYHRPTDVILAIIKYSNELLIVHAEPFQVESITLRGSEMPLSVSVRADGMYAAVGYQKSLVLINLITHEVSSVYPIPVSCEVQSLSLDGWAYVFAEDNVYGVNILTAEVFGNSVSAFGCPQINQGDNTIYLINRDGYTNIQKFSLRGGRVQSLYGKGLFNYSNIIWLPDNQEYIFTSNGHIYTSSTDKKKDLIDSGMLSSVAGISPKCKSIDRSSNSKRIVLLPQDSNELQFYEDRSFQYLSSLYLPDIYVWNSKNGLMPSPVKGQYAFFNDTGMTLMVLATDITDNLSGLITYSNDLMP